MDDDDDEQQKGRLFFPGLGKVTRKNTRGLRTGAELIVYTQYLLQKK